VCDIVGKALRKKYVKGDVSYFFRRIGWFNRRKYCETGHHHEAEYSSYCETRNILEISRNWRLYTIL